MSKTVVKEKPILVPPKIEMFYTIIRAKNTAIVLYQVQETILEDGIKANQKTITEPDIKDITLSKMIGFVERTLR